MRSLHVKLLLIFLAVSLAGSFLAAFLVRRANERAFDRLLRQQGQAYFVRDVQAYYIATGTLEGMEPLLHWRYARGGGGRGNRGVRAGQGRETLPFAVADATGRIAVPAGRWQQGEEVPAGQLRQGLPVVVNGETVGTVLLLDWAPVRNAIEQQYLRGINRALLLGALGATAIAVALGGLLAHTLTQPLREVAEASHAVAHGALGRQVPVRSQDELGELAMAFNSMSAELARATQQRRQMTADIAHDLRTPLTVLAGYLEAMEEGTLRPTPERLAIMQQEVAGLTRLVEDLRTLSLADAGELTLQLQEVDPTRLLRQVQQAYAQQAEERQVDLQVEVNSNLAAVTVDPERMRQVLGNLVSNALRHTGAGGKVLLGATNDASPGLLLTVRDTGAGISAEDLPHVFDRFYRGDRARGDGQGASGLGLAIARSLVEMHGGTITVESAPGKGTAFFIRLP